MLPEGVGRVVDDSQVVVVCDFLNGIDIAGVAVAVHRHDGRFDLAGIKVERVGGNVDEHGFDAIPQQ